MPNPGFLSNEDLNFMRQTIASGMNRSAVIRRWQTPTNDGAGGTTSQYVDQPAVNCLMAPTGASNTRQIAERLAGVVSWVFTFDASVTIGIKDLIVVNGETYEVKGVKEDGSYNIENRVYCDRVVLGNEVN